MVIWIKDWLNKYGKKIQLCKLLHYPLPGGFGKTNQSRFAEGQTIKVG
jgi:hypothetical protein